MECVCDWVKASVDQGPQIKCFGGEGCNYELMQQEIALVLGHGDLPRRWSVFGLRIHPGHAFEATDDGLLVRRDARDLEEEVVGAVKFFGRHWDTSLSV